MTVISRHSVPASTRPVASQHHAIAKLRSGFAPGNAPTDSVGCSDPIRFCSRCGTRVEIQIPPWDQLPRHVCPTCSHVQYRNPKIIVGIIPETQDGRVVLCRRAIPPRRGFWTFPAGYLENGETGEQGAKREAQEEAGVRTESLGLYMVINALAAQEVHLVYRGRLRSPASSGASFLAHGPESAEVLLVCEDDIPWEDLAHPTIGTCLRRYFSDRASGRFPVHTIDVTGAHPLQAEGLPASWSKELLHVD